ncbi:MAG TPA: hypothetical protein VLV89_01065 [Candidatus Acidoferrum sp.]|nr:hypothetical protein [Candidatus Acidoferrum sp.]
MRAKSLKYLVAFLAVMTLVIPAVAKDITKGVTILNETKIAGKILKPGDYNFKISDTKLIIEVNHKVVAEVAGHWTPGDTKWDADEFRSGPDGQVQEIRLMGEKGVFIVGQ